MPLQDRCIRFVERTKLFKYIYKKRFQLHITQFNVANQICRGLVLYKRGRESTTSPGPGKKTCLIPGINFASARSCRVDSSSYLLLVSLSCFPLGLSKTLQISSLPEGRDSRSNRHDYHHSDFHFLQLKILSS